MGQGPRSVEGRLKGRGAGLLTVFISPTELSSLKTPSEPLASFKISFASAHRSRSQRGEPVGLEAGCSSFLGGCCSIPEKRMVGNKHVVAVGVARVAGF